MKILHINKQFYRFGGTDTYFFGLTALLERNGHSVIPFSTIHPDNEPSLHARYFAPDVETAEGGLARIKNLGRVFYSPDIERRVRDIARRERPDIAHVHHLFHKLSPSALIGLRRERIPVVMTVHDHKFICPNYTLSRGGGVCQECRGRRYWRAVAHRCVKGSLVKSAVCAIEMWAHRRLRIYEKNVDMFIVPSVFLARKLHEDGFVMPHFMHIPNFTDTNMFKPGNTDSGYILYCGKLERFKGVHVLLEAFSAVVAKTNSRCLIVGEGSERAALEAGLGETPRDRVEFLGRRNKEELRELIRDARCVVVPSVCFENGSMTIIEAMSCGRPVVASRIGGNGEYVEDGVTGLLFTPGDAADLSRKLDELLGDPRRAGAMGRLARQRALERLSPAVHYESIMNAYRAVLERSGGRENAR